MTPQLPEPFISAAFFLDAIGTLFAAGAAAFLGAIAAYYFQLRMEHKREEDTRRQAIWTAIAVLSEHAHFLERMEEVRKRTHDPQDWRVHPYAPHRLELDPRSLTFLLQSKYKNLFEKAYQSDRLCKTVESILERQDAIEWRYWSERSGPVPEAQKRELDAAINKCLPDAIRMCRECATELATVERELFPTAP